MKDLISTIRKKQKGFTLIEIMIALLIMSIVIGAIYELYIHQYKTWVAQDLLSEMQQNARVAVNTMSRELMMAGYDAGGIDAASSTSITFQEYVETATKVQQITFARNVNNDLTREIKDRQSTEPDTWSAGTTQDLAENITSLSFNYYDSSNNDLGATPTLGDIRRVQISVTAQTARALPTTNSFKTQTLRIDIYPRNISIDTGFVDVSPPSTPTNFVASDPHICGELNLTWDANTESDLAGYVIYYGQLTGEYDTRIEVEDSTATSYTLTGLTNTDANDITNTVYYVVISAYDRAGNVSSYSTEASGDGTGIHDTVLNADNPAPPANFEAANGADGEVVLTWTASIDTDVVGYRLFRDTTAGFTPSGPTAGTGSCIADESSLTSTTYTDTGLIGCRTYYYKICAINCDINLVSSYDSVADYPNAFGDGGGTDIVPDVPTNGVTDSTPTDAATVTDPKLASHAGYMRIFVTLTNPNLTDDPDYVSTEIRYSTTSPATLSDPLVENDASDVSSGMFTSRGVTSVTTTATFTHTGEATGTTPALNPNLTYYYTAFAYDLCGNVTSASAESTTLAVLCDDEPSPEPPATTDLSASGCVHPIVLTWSWMDVTFPDGIYDLAGYYIYRSTDGGVTYGDSLNSSPMWTNEFTDAGVVEGVEYKYYITASDCVAENNPAAQSIADRGGDLESDPSNIVTVTPGSITQDDVQDEVFTGDISVVDATATPPLPTYYHNTVKIYIENTSAGTITLTDLYLSWINSTAYLKSITIGGETSATLEEVVWEDTVLPLTHGYTGASISISKQIEALDSGVPFILEFAYSDGTIDERANIREDDISIDVTYTNDSTGTTTCTSGGTIEVPLGPTIVGTAQDQPAVATLAWSAPGSSGTSVAGEHVVDPNVAVNVSAYIYDNSNVGFNSVTLYYITTDKATASAPVYDGANYTPLTMYNISGDLYRIYVNIITGQKIPMQNDLRVWYFIVAEDCDGNFDRDPEIGSGAYTYDQQADDPCFDTPNIPTGMSGWYTLVAPGSDSVTLNWTAPATNTSGSPLTDLDGYNIYRKDTFGGAFVKINAALVALTTYTDSSLDLNANDYGYYVTAVDTCGNESAASNMLVECVGSAGCNMTAIPTNLYVGDGYTLRMIICDKAWDFNPGEIITVYSTSSVDDDIFTVVEDGDTGMFTINLTTTGIDPLVSGIFSNTEIYVDATDTITIGYPDAVGSSCSATVSVSTDPCLNTPNAPSGLAGVGSGNWTVALSWTAPVTNTDASALSDLAGYRIYESVDGGPYINIASADSATTTYTRSVQSGQLKFHDYNYYVAAIDTCAIPNQSAASNIAGPF